MGDAFLLDDVVVFSDCNEGLQLVGWQCVEPQRTALVLPIVLSVSIALIVAGIGVILLTHFKKVRALRKNHDRRQTAHIQAFKGTML